jgi:hypothetical protein
LVRPLSVFVALALAGCQQQSGDTPSGQPHRASTQPAAQASPSARKPLGRAVLDADGVVFDGPGGKTAQFTFGTLRGAVETSAARRFGAAEMSANDECGAGPMEFARYGPLTLNFQDDKLVGWLAQEGPGVVTTDGISPGKLMRDLKVARSAHMIEGSTLAGEFEYIAADGLPIGGFVKGAGRDARIVTLYAGVNCFFR